MSQDELAAGLLVALGPAYEVEHTLGEGRFEEDRVLRWRRCAASDPWFFHGDKLVDDYIPRLRRH